MLVTEINCGRALCLVLYELELELVKIIEGIGICVGFRFPFSFCSRFDYSIFFVLIKKWLPFYLQG